MNAGFTPQSLRVVQADLADGALCRRIDGFVAAHPQGTPFHRSCWGRAVEAGTGQRFVCLVASDAAGDIAGILPVHIVHSPLFGRALVSAGFGVGGGPLVATSHAIAPFADAAWALAQRESCPSVELRGGPIERLRGWNVIDDRHTGFVAPLADDDEAQLKAIPRKQRAEVRKGLAHDFEIRTGSGTAERDAHYAVYAESVRNLGTPVFPRALFDAVLDQFGDAADILTVYADDRALASVLSLYHGSAVMPYWGGGVFDARRLRANEVMYYALMNHARERGCETFDFGRSKTGTGAYHFKRNWGFEPEPLAYAVRAADGAVPRDVNPLSPKYRAQIALWQRLPLPVANRIGPWIAKGLG